MALVKIVLLIGMAIAVSVGATWALFSVHGEQPHRDAVHREVYNRDIRDLKDDIRHIRNKQDRMLELIIELRESKE